MGDLRNYTTNQHGSGVSSFLMASQFEPYGRSRIDTEGPKACTACHIYSS